MFWFFYVLITNKLKIYTKINKNLDLNLIYFFLKNKIRSIYLDSYNEKFFYINKKNLSLILKFLKLNFLLQYNVLVDILGSDFITKKKRFYLNYNLLSIKNNSRINFVIKVKEFEVVYSLYNVFKSSNWSEREIWDLYGIFFKGHINLNRILTDYGFKGHPLRKDFPLSGYKEIFYDDSKKRIIKSRISLAQEYRNFTFNESNW